MDIKILLIVLLFCVFSTPHTFGVDFEVIDSDMSQEHKIEKRFHQTQIENPTKVLEMKLDKVQIQADKMFIPNDEEEKNAHKKNQESRPIEDDFYWPIIIFIPKQMFDVQFLPFVSTICIFLYEYYYMMFFYIYRLFLPVSF